MNAADAIALEAAAGTPHLGTPHRMCAHSYLRSAHPVSGRPHLGAAEGVSGFGEILVKADEGLTAFRLG